MNNGEWSREQEKAFVCAIAADDQEDDAGRWERIAARLSGKTAEEVKAHYDLLLEDIDRIESGSIPLLDCVDKDNKKATPRRRESTKWTPAEHRAFLRGIKEGNKGDWRCISRWYVPTKSSSQVASHAQKYFLRQEDPSKRKRQSIHDVSLETLAAAAANEAINGHPAVRSNSGSIAGQPTRQTDWPADGRLTNNGIPALDNDNPMNGSSVPQPLRFGDPSAPAYSTPINLGLPQTDWPADGRLTNSGIPYLDNDNPMNGSSVLQPLRFCDPTAPAYSTPINLGPPMNGSSVPQPLQFRNPSAPAYSTPINLSPPMNGSSVPQPLRFRDPTAPAYSTPINLGPPMNGSSVPQPLQFRDPSAPAYSTPINLSLPMNGSSVPQPLPAYSNPINLCPQQFSPGTYLCPQQFSSGTYLHPQQLSPGTFIPLFRSDDPRASLSNVAPIDANHQVPNTLARLPLDSCHCPVSQDSATSFPVRHCSHCPSNA